MRREEKGMTTRRVRVLIVKTSLDGHWRGVAAVTTALRDAGMEVIYGGMQSSEQIAQTVLQEDVDVVGLNIGGRYGHIRELMQILQKERLSDLLVVAGGNVPRDDIPELKEMGIAGVFPPGSALRDIVAFVTENAPVR